MAHGREPVRSTTQTGGGLPTDYTIAILHAGAPPYCEVPSFEIIQSRLVTARSRSCDGLQSTNAPVSTPPLAYE